MIIQRGHEYGVFHFYSKETGLLSKQIVEHCSLSPERAFFLINFGSVYVNGQRTKDDILVQSSTYVRAHTTPRRFLHLASVQIEKLILFESDDFIIVHKPSGLPVHDTVDNCVENLIRQLEKYLKNTLFITHRLDVPTEGLIVFAKNINFQKHFNNLLINKNIKKIYKAEIENSNQRQLPVHLVHYMKKSQWAPKQIFESPEPETQQCLLQILNQTHLKENKTSVLYIELLTGRTHQIRAQLSFTGFPIINDVMYGAKLETINNDESLYEKIHLTAIELEFKYFETLYSFKTKTSW